MKKILRTVIGSLAIALILPISSCEKAGCTNPAASNYSSSATKDDGSCKIPGCTDPAATNYNSAATVNNYSCVYPSTNGQVVFYVNSASSAVTVNINGQQGTFSGGYYASGAPSCGSQYCATFTLPQGVYNFTASSQLGTNWSGTVIVTTNGCTQQGLLP